jgi:hypothetical protein
MNDWLSWLTGHPQDAALPGMRSKHMYVVGQPGIGKSRALESWVMQDVASGRGVGVVDVHEELFTHLLRRLAGLSPAVWDRVVIIDPTYSRWTVRFNPLEVVVGMSSDRLAGFLTDVVVKIWGIDSTESPRMVWLLKNAFLVLSELGLSLVELPRLLLDTPYRELLLPRLTNPVARDYFQREYPQNPASVLTWAAPVLNKLGGLIFDQEIQPMLTGPSTINFRAILDGQQILLVNLPKGVIGEGVSALLGAFIVAHLQKAALSRNEALARPPFYLYLDEFQNYTTDNIKDILSESRKYNLSLIMAHQYLDQLSPALLSAVLNTTGILNCFRVGYRDGYALAPYLFSSPGALSEEETQVKMSHLAGVPLLHFQRQVKPLGWEGLAAQLANLPDRVFWSRQRGLMVPQKLRTPDMPIPRLTRELSDRLAAMLERVGRRCGAPKTGSSGGETSGGNGHHPQEATGESWRGDGNIPLWGN